MRRTEQAQGLRLMKFEEVYGRTLRGVLGQAEAAEILGVSERTFRRCRDRFEADGAEGLYDRRLGRVSARRAPVDEVARVLALFDTRYWDFIAKHFHEKLVSEHGCRRSYNWVRLNLQAHGRKRPAPRQGTMLSFRALSEEIPGARSVLLALRRPGQPLLAHARGRRGQDAQLHRFPLRRPLLGLRRPDRGSGGGDDAREQRPFIIAALVRTVETAYATLRDAADELSRSAPG